MCKIIPQFLAAKPGQKDLLMSNASNEEQKMLQAIVPKIAENETAQAAAE